MPDARPLHPGVALKERFLDPLGIAPSQLARAISLPTRDVEALASSARDLDADMAFRLALYFDVPARWWTEMQARFDAVDPARLDELRREVTPFEGLDGVLVTPNGIRRLDEQPAEPAEPAALTVSVSPELEARLRAQAALAPPRPDRTPVVVYLDDGTPILTST